MVNTLRISTGCRLHFGLFRVGPELSLERAYGGAGAMVDGFGWTLELCAAERFSFHGPQAQRVAAAVRRWTNCAAQLPPARIEVLSEIPAHAGLGSGTQLELAVAHALGIWRQAPLGAPVEIARSAGRGARSAVGIHGFAGGGLVIEAGRRSQATAPAPAVCQVPLPADWRFVLVTSAAQPGLSGEQELTALGQLPESTREQTAELARLALLHLAPAALEAQYQEFARALFEFNCLVGQWFAAVQGGTYARRFGARVVGRCRALDFEGVGQSSWGPTIFALAEGEERAQWLAERLRDDAVAEGYRVVVARPRNHGAVCQELPVGDGDVS